MKRLIFIVAILTGIYSLYYDLTVGTLPSAQQPSVQQHQTVNQVPDSEQQINTNIQAEEVIVEAGYTVLSIVEHLHEEPVSASIQEIINDFKTLNPGTDPDEIRVDQTYYFPVYNR